MTVENISPSDIDFVIHDLPRPVVRWLSRCGELEGSSAEDCARAILEREWRRFDIS